VSADAAERDDSHPVANIWSHNQASVPKPSEYLDYFTSSGMRNWKKGCASIQESI